MKSLVLFFLAIAMIASLSASSLIDATKTDIPVAPLASAPDKVQTTVIVCGEDPDGNLNCVETVYNDGADCLIIDDDDFARPKAHGPDC